MPTQALSCRKSVVVAAALLLMGTSTVVFSDGDNTGINGGNTGGGGGGGVALPMDIPDGTNGFTIQVSDDGSDLSGNSGPSTNAASDAGSNDASSGYATTPPNAAQSGDQSATTCSGQVSNPVNIADGNKVSHETDFRTHGSDPLRFVRFYNRTNTNPGIFGPSWHTAYDRYLSFNLSETLGGGSCTAAGGKPASCVSSTTPTSSISSVTVIRSDGSAATYSWQSGSTYANASPDANDLLTHNNDGSWSLAKVNGEVQNYSAGGMIQSTSDATGLGWTYNYSGNYLSSAVYSSGQSVSFGWTGNVVTSVQDFAGNTYGYSYTNGMLTGISYPNGNTRTYYYENSALPNALTGIAINGVRYSVYSYNTSGTVYQSGHGSDGSVNRATFSYNQTNPNAPVTTVTNALGAASTYTYNVIQSEPKLVSTSVSGVTNCPTYTASTYYDSYGHPTYSLDQRGIRTNYTYQPNGLLTDITYGIDSSGQQRETRYGYDSMNRVTDEKHLGPNSSAIVDIATTYYPASSPSKNRLQQIQVTNLSSNGVANQVQTTNYTYSFYSSGMVSQMVVSGPLAGPTQYTVTNYDTNGDVTSIADANGNATSYSNYNGLGEPQTVTGPNGYTVTTTYDTRGRATGITINSGGVTSSSSYTYDGMNKVLTSNDSNGLWTYTYDSAERLLSKTTVLGTLPSDVYTYTTTNGYDALSDLTSATITTNVEVETCHIIQGRQICSTSNTASTVYSHSYVYDTIGRLLNSKGNNGQNFAYSYDADSNVATKTDSTSHTWTYGYNPFNQLQSVGDPLGHQALYTYDGAGNPETITDLNTHTTGYTWDGFGHRVSISSPDTGSTGFVYYATGLLNTMTRNDGTVTTYYYDNLNRLQTVVVGSQTQGYTYDTCTNGKTQLCSFTDGSGSTAYTYTPSGQIASQVSTINSNSYTTSFTYGTYDLLKTATYPSGTVLTYAYNSASQPQSVSTLVNGTNQNVATYGYLVPGLPQVSNIYTADEGASGWTYDTDLRLTSISASTGNGQTAIQSLSYGYDTNNNMTGITNALNSNLTQTFGYDAVYRLTGVTAGVGNQSIGLDGNGNRTAYTLAGGASTYSVNSNNNQISSISGGSTRSFTYDALGNTHIDNGSLGNRTLNYDGFNHLISFSNGSGTTNYSYNALGQRVAKSGASGGYAYIYDAAGDLLAETAQNSASIGTQYIWLGGKLVGVEISGTVYCVHNDHLGRPDTATYTGGGIAWQAGNTAFTRSVTTSAITLNIGFPGQYYDAESGFFYNLNRYYDPTLGRYVHSDPIGLQGGMNTYAYVGGNPVSGVDPTGEGGLYLGGAGQASGPGLTGGGNAILAAGNNNGYVELTGYASANYGNYSFGFSAGKGITGGFYLGDTSDFLNGYSVNVDSMFGGLSLLFDSSGAFIGFGLSGPSFGVSVYATGGVLSQGNPSAQRTFFSSSVVEDIPGMAAALFCPQQ
jgi:RHS repeat-associated protein